MRKDGLPTRMTLPPPSKSKARCRRLKRGLARWDQERQLCGERTQRAILLTFTITGDWQTEAQGRMRRFWQDVRNTWLGTRYFCWAELTRKGQLHYHAWWINPPHVKRVNLIAWVKKHWGDDRTSVTFPHESHPAGYLTSYVMKYAYKMGAKRYQQVYDTMPSSLRTFMCQRSDIPHDVLDQHRDRDEYQYVAEDVYRGVVHPAYIEKVAHVEHAVPAGARCSALDSRRSRLHPDWTRPGPKYPGGGRR